jgi:HEAT repeat protein
MSKMPLAFAALAILRLTTPARGGIDPPLALGIIVVDAKHIVVVEVEEWSPERALVVYKKVSDLKGTHAGTRVRHGRVPGKAEEKAPGERRGPPAEILAELLAPGRRAVFFHNGEFGVVYLGKGMWYSAGVPKPADAAGNWGIWLPQYGFGYAGGVEPLERAVRTMLQGKEVVVPAFAGSPVVGDLVFSLLAEPRRLPMALWQIRAGQNVFRIPAGTPKRFAEGYALHIDDEARKLIIGKGSSRAAELDTLLVGLKHESARTRIRYADEIGLIGPEAKRAATPLSALLKDSEAPVRLAAASALARIEPGHSAAARLLLETLKDKSLTLRLQAVDALWSLEASVPGTVPALIATARDPEKKLRERSAAALRSLLRAVPPPDAVSVADLVGALRAGDEDARRLAVIALRHKPAAELRPIVPDIATMLRDGNAWVRAEAAGTLARLDPKHRTLAPVLVQILEDSTHKHVYPGGMIRKAALDALGRIGPAARHAVPALCQAIEEYREVPEAVEILKQLGGEAKAAAGVLQKVVKRPAPVPYPELPMLAAATLADVAPTAPGNEPAIALLIIWVKDRTKRMDDRLTAVAALGRFGAPAAAAIPALEEALKDQFQEIRQAAAVALKQIRAP